MTSVYSTDQIDMALQYTVSGQVVVKQEVLISDSANPAFYATHLQKCALTNYGFVQSWLQGIFFGAGTDNSSIFNAPTGTISGDTGVVMDGDSSRLTNLGSIEGDAFGIEDWSSYDSIRNSDSID